MNDTQSVIIQLLREHGALTHIQLSERLGLSSMGVIKSLTILKRAGFIEFIRCETTGPGRPSNAARVAANAGFALGISVKRLEVELALVNLQNTVLDFIRLPISFLEETKKETHLTPLYSAIQKMLRVVPPGKLRGIGISISGNFDTEKGLLNKVNDFVSVEQANSFRDLLGRKYKVPVCLVHDTETGLISERWCNQSLPPHPNLLYVRDRLGFSIMLQGKLFRGNTEWCSWLGRVQTSFAKKEKTHLWGWDMGVLPSTLMETASVDSWIDRMHGFPPGGRTRSDTEGERQEIQELFNHWTQRDPKVRKIVRQGLNSLALVIRNLCLTLPFDRIILNGWTPGILSVAIEETNAVLSEGHLAFDAMFKDINPPVAASILGDRTDAVGAALWAFDQYLQARIALRGWKKGTEKKSLNLTIE